MACFHTSQTGCQQMHPTGAILHLSSFSTPGLLSQLSCPRRAGQTKEAASQRKGRSLHHPHQSLSPARTCIQGQWPSLGQHSTSHSASSRLPPTRDRSLQLGPAHPAASLWFRYILDPPPCQRCYQSAKRTRDTGPTLKTAREQNAQAQKERGSALPRVLVCDVAVGETTFPTNPCERVSGSLGR